MRTLWDNFVISLRQKRDHEGFSENSQNLRDMLPPPHVREMMRKMREAGEIVQAPIMTRAPTELKPVVVELAPSSPERLRMVAERCGSAGALFLKPRHRCEVGRRIQLVLIHPVTDEQHTLEAVAERVVTGDDGVYAGVQARFAVLPAAEKAALHAFALRRPEDIGTSYGSGATPR